MQLSLDHITVTDVTPARLAEIAAATGCSGICPFLHSMEVLPAMPVYDLVRDAVARRETKAALSANGVTVDLFYPFTVAGRTVVADFAPVLETGAELGGSLANVLCYDRDPVRRTEKLIELADLAASFGVRLAIEFYPPAQVRTLAETLAEIERTGRADIGVTLDLLHVMRGGETEASMALLGDPRVWIGQVSDGPASVPVEMIDHEAGIQRLLPGQGVFDIAGFAHALAPGVPISVEVPQQSAIDAGLSPLDRARAAVDAMCACLGE
ncbi:sugar phosphate isomerase/epimerase [Sphingobium sp. OAS761]|uniref:sugar phosphate isomerase/epimerase family protein n=1 Tax=Sphingobium sp. OAS761 TaxID=2817901 RepID=UPI00209FE450|nr:sugar phosphate isomerase/epimerase [Sphingobium sp. OAS761]MCP1471742.1 sugar phosphate isomerase/epimerase [Sphingobium sp. OAS761]